jgi:RNA polymerase sigma-70 factor (ECF subfamily)
MEDHPEMREEQRVITLILAGQNQLFHELIRPYERRVYMMALSFVRNEADAEEIAQEAFLKAFCKLADFRGEAKFGTWLISITLNEARSLLRRKRFASTKSLDTTLAGDRYLSPALLRDGKESPSEVLERLEINLILQQAIASLPAIYREVLLLRDVEELNTKEVAKVLKISLSSAKVRLHRARTMMQKLLARRVEQRLPKRTSRASPPAKHIPLSSMERFSHAPTGPPREPKQQKTDVVIAVVERQQRQARNRRHAE